MVYLFRRCWSSHCQVKYQSSQWFMYDNHPQCFKNRIPKEIIIIIIIIIIVVVVVMKVEVMNQVGTIDLHCTGHFSSRIGINIGWIWIRTRAEGFELFLDRRWKLITDGHQLMKWDLGPSQFGLIRAQFSRPATRIHTWWIWTIRPDSADAHQLMKWELGPSKWVPGVACRYQTGPHRATNRQIDADVSTTRR